MSNQRIVHIATPAVGEEEFQACRECFETGWMTQGPKVAEFEKAFAERHEAGHALATSSCSTALHLILAAMDIKPGDEVIVPAFTWIATANAVLYCRATPIFVDIDPETFNIDPASVAAKITDKTRAVIAVHLFGLPADIDALREVTGDIPIVEDAACGAGAAYKGRPLGTFGVAGAFSFHPRKSISTGEGGMVVTNDDALAATMDKMRNHGAEISEAQRLHGPRPYLLPEFNVLGYNYRMTDLQGAVGLVQLGKLDAFIDERNHWADFYRRELAELDWLRCPTAPADCRHAYQAFVTWVDPERSPQPRNVIMERLKMVGIATRPGTHAVHALGLYRDRFGLKPEDCPNAWAADRNSMAIPLHNRMTAEDYEYVVEQLKKIAGGAGKMCVCE